MQLNLPAFDVRIVKEASGLKIYDSVRRKLVALTPEEWVRQHFVHYLISEKHVPESLIANEIGLTLNGTQRRCDTVIFDSHGSPAAIVEYKAPTVPVTQKVFDQIVRYNMVLKTRYLIVSNGMVHYCCETDYKKGTCRFIDEVPDYTELIK